MAKRYIERNIIVSGDLKAVLLYDVSKKKSIKLDDNNTWVETEPEDDINIDKSARIKELHALTKNQFSNTLGFIGYEKNNKYLVFKTKNMELKRNTGARCDEAGKHKTIDALNSIIGHDKYNKENTKLIKDKKGNVIQAAMGQTELCILQEFILRFFNEIRKDNKIWFVNTEVALLLQL